MAKRTEEHLSVLNKGLVFDGHLEATGTLIINGTIKGQVGGEFITIGEGGLVEAEMKALNITVGGRFKGKLEALQKLVILPSGQCEGEIRCRDMVIEPGGGLNGQVTRITEPPPDKKAKKKS